MGGENAANGPPNSTDATVEGSGNGHRPPGLRRGRMRHAVGFSAPADAAPRPEAGGHFEAPPRPEMPPRTDSAAAFEPAALGAVAPPPAREIAPPRQIEPPQGPAGNDSKYVSYGRRLSGDVPRSGPDDR